MFLLEFSTYVLISLLAEALAWGGVGYIVMRMIRNSTRYWFVEVLVILVPFIVYDMWSSSLLTKLDITIGNSEILDFLDGDISIFIRMGPFDYLIATLQISLGYLVGRAFFAYARKFGSANVAPN